MNSNYAWKLGLKIRKTNIEVQKIDNIILKFFEIMIADFQIEDKIDKSRFFEKVFLVVDTKFELILKKKIWK